MQKGKKQDSWRATVTEVVTDFSFKSQCGNPGLILGTYI